MPIPMNVSPTQQKRVNKVARLREFFKGDAAGIYEWKTTDEAYDFSLMSDADIKAYFARQEDY